MRGSADVDDLRSHVGETTTMEERWKRAAADLANDRKPGGARAGATASAGARSRLAGTGCGWWTTSSGALMNRDTATLESLLEGVQAVYRQAGQVLGQYGVSRMQTVDTPFDPEKHEAIACAPGRPTGTILDEVRPRLYDP